MIELILTALLIGAAAAVWYFASRSAKARSDLDHARETLSRVLQLQTILKQIVREQGKASKKFLEDLDRASTADELLELYKKSIKSP